MLNPHKRCQETRRLLNEGARLVDVRTENEYRQGALQDAINHPVEWISAGYHPQEEKETPLIVYCVSGNRSSAAKNMLLAAGFKNVHDLGSYQNIQFC
ncbi:MAG TPA: rhodanese-like domain-containing protein [Gammaproteobacteria bacterium]|nr:molybdopterin biosynthesis protein MoeB [bacterium BMS3Abin11]GMT40501.1 MAG: phage-shock protein [bacterium]HDH16483.1 rhodanese-like domain-containing protein [Gammaproteobacteria bacterium]HDZ77945.1 rhodanese-like domain-containing protein [Gammaproteobacteria bacterium]